jgi:hypothetical protein
VLSTATYLPVVGCALFRRVQYSKLIVPSSVHEESGLRDRVEIYNIPSSYRCQILFVSRMTLNIAQSSTASSSITTPT